MVSAHVEHRAAQAEFTAATADYEAALMSGDETRIATADERLTDAERAYSETLAALVRRHSLRQSLPSFTEMLAHPWAQPPEPSKAAMLASIQEYANAQSDTVALPVRPAHIDGSGATDA